MKRKLYITLLGLLSTIMMAAVPYCDVRKFSITDGLAANTISDLKQGKDNLMWFSTWNGLSFYDGYKFHTFRDNPDDIDVLSTNHILKIEPSYNNNVWCITYDHKLYVYDTHFCQFFAVGQKFNELFNIDLRVSQVYPLKNGATWFTSEDGKYIIRSIGKTFDERNIELIKVGEKGLRSGNVWYIHQDIHGREWVLTDKGAYIYHSKIPSKLPFKWLRGVGEDEFLATEDGKLAKYDLQNRLTMIPMPEGVTRINGLKNTGYQLLMATNLGVAIYNPRTFKFDIINVQSPSQPLAEVKKIYIDDFGMVWAFTDGIGVTLVNPKTGQTQWLFADQDDPMDRTTCESNFITQDEHKTLWVVPRGGTFSYFDRKAGKLVPYLLRSNSSGNYRIPKITKYVLSDQGRIWVIRESSIDCVNPKTGQCNVFGPNDFDFNMSFSQSRPYHDPASNNISVGTPMGLITFNPATLKKSNYQPKVIFCSLHYSGEKESEPILHKDKVVIPANKRNLTINFASLDYQRKYQTRYLYRIDGFTAPGVWISNGSSNTIGFNRISHGDYVLKVRATNSHGVWSKYVAELPIEVRPTFWESIWGKFLMLLLLFGIVGAIFYTYNQRQHENVTHEMSVMKNEFYNDAANRLRTPLTLIGAPVKTVLDTEPGITRKGKELLKMVADNANEMLVMLDKVQRYGNKADFHTNSGLSEEDYDLAEREKENGQIDDRNASDYLEEVNKQKEEKDEEAERLEEMGKEQKEAQEEAEHKDQTVLVVEDNADLRKFLYSILSPTYNVLLAENGKAGLVMARKETPDFILTDVTMPVMDGLSMIHEIKQDTTLNNIPVMILSAKASVEDQQRGFDEGVDAYITKPFSTPYLLGRIEAILTQRRNIQMDVIRKLKETGDKDAIAALRILPAAAPLPALNQAETSAENEAVNPNSELAFMAAQIQDRTMMRIFRFVVENAGNPELKIDDISNEIGMSRSVLYNKVKATTGMTPVDFVRHIRIKKACEILRNTDDTLTSIAFAVGFTDPKYFSKVFKKETGIVPTEYRNRTQG